MREGVDEKDRDPARKTKEVDISYVYDCYFNMTRLKVKDYLIIN